MLAALTAILVLNTIAPGGKAAVEKKIAELGASMGNMGYEVVSSEGPEVPSLQEIAKMPVELREQHYIRMAENESSNGEFSRAREIINERVKTPSQRIQALKQLEEQEMYRALGQGKVADVLRILNGFAIVATVRSRCLSSSSRLVQGISAQQQSACWSSYEAR